jgi:hypothetical protein
MVRVGEFMENRDIFFLIVKARKWKNGYLQQYCEYWHKTSTIGWQYTDFKDKEAFDKWKDNK